MQRYPRTLTGQAAEDLLPPYHANVSQPVSGRSGLPGSAPLRPKIKPRPVGMLTEPPSPTPSVPQPKWERVRAAQAAALQGGGPARVAKQHERGKLTARERLAALFDPGSFHEAGALVQHRCTDFGMADQQFYGERAWE